jgi:hypothetical protein
MSEPKERRLGNVLLNGLELACEQKDLEVARLLHQALQLVMTRRTGRDEVEKRPELADAVQAATERYFALERSQS